MQITASSRLQSANYLHKIMSQKWLELVRPSVFMLLLACSLLLLRHVVDSKREYFVMYQIKKHQQQQQQQHQLSFDLTAFWLM